jgi:hypothetical protein
MAFESSLAMEVLAPRLALSIWKSEGLTGHRILDGLASFAVNLR